jgi:hypothetical protein
VTGEAASVRGLRWFPFTKLNPPLYWPLSGTFSELNCVTGGAELLVIWCKREMGFYFPEDY